MNKIVLVCSAVVGVSLYFLYALTVVLFLQHLILSSIVLIEVVIILAQFAKLVGVVGHYGRKPARPEVLLILFSAETLLVLALIIVYAASPSVYMSNLVNTVFSTWVAALFIVVPSYLIFAAVMQMTRNRSPIVALLSPTLGFGFLAFAASTMLASSSNFTFSTFFQYLIGVARYDISSGTIPALTHLYILVPSVAVFSSMFIYATVPSANSVVPPRVAFVLPLLAAIVTLAWVFAGVLVVRNTLLSFTLPGMIVVALLWAYMRR
jgi:hypothetical protein